mmetsp:Transcript_11210/g.22810  ORF Transcript_11210/g.22810 Transcript_11210/m.22810 type:complete len:144 (-) Transcript_11210:29-460(-)
MNPAVQYNATIYHKGVPPKRDDLGKVFVDVVDDFTLSGSIVPKDFEIIVQNEFQSEVFPRHKTHIIEHWYNTDPSDTYVHEIAEASPLKVGTVCFLCPYPGIPSDLDVNSPLSMSSKREYTSRNGILNSLVLKGGQKRKRATF